MLNNFIGGGQVFLHKIRMLRQVVGTTVFVSLLSGAILAWSFNSSSTHKVDWDGAITYAKAKLAITVHPALSAIALRPSKANVDAYSNDQLWKKRMLASSVVTSNRFLSAWRNATEVMYLLSLQAVGYGIAAGFLVFLLWSKFGKNLKDERKNEGSGVVLTVIEVGRILRNMGKCSDFKIGKMPLVKDMETRHFLVTGSTGSGKTNLIHNLLPQVEAKGQPVVVIDQTGEMVAKYYNPKRGDIIFNPFDARGKVWDFWADCSKLRNLEKFADTLIGFNSRKNNKATADFWEEAAQSVFVDCVKYLQGREQFSIEELRKIICKSDNEELKEYLKGSDSAKHFSKDNIKTAASIMSVLMTGIKPLRFLSDKSEAGSFSIQDYLHGVDAGSSSWLFLASEPSTRELTIPLNASLAELVIAYLMVHNTPKNRKLWFIMDELAAFGRFPSLAKLMQEGRKYGTCVLAGLQSSSQLFSHYGQGDASNLFALFKTKFAFQSDDPMMGRLYSSICGSETITRQQKNTSFGANEFRDGVSYNEQQQEKPLVKVEDFALLGLGECFTLLPEPAVRLSKMKTPEAKVPDKNQGFVEKEEEFKTTSATSFWQDAQNELASNAVIRERNLAVSNEIIPKLQEAQGQDLDIDEDGN